MAKAVDPVCGMEVETSSAMYKTVYKGKIYYFCSPQCKTAFEKNPEYYLTHGPQGMPGHEHHEHHGHHGHGHGCGC
ncbi:conserved hypothetical protein [Aeropyrum pernix]|uniref:TRASH domain-containing protein n=1 Tax=Aeropyrum pernix TaxID=56636 RepID=A0A401H787_AERPX|nr:YHS domain-containing protein [Aeropyrum pernix]GBF08316.1 conserved hypothetical protein [Aeropyrum pernix]